MARRTSNAAVISGFLAALALGCSDSGGAPRESVCGDGIVSGAEQCDDGNQRNDDACLDTCVVARCGDGFVQAGVEECDDGNASNTDACLDTCVAARCGDGFVRVGVEQCDDGNLAGKDGCSPSCTNEPPPVAPPPFSALL